MIGIRSPGEIGLVAGIAGGRRVHVVVVGVALHAGERRVNSGEWIVGVRRMIEVDGGPVRRRMAGVAGGGKSCCSVRRVCGAIPIRLVAAEASSRQCCVVVVDMALRARNGGMSASQREDRSMIERRRRPAARGMAECAVGRESARDMRGVRSSIKVRLVASITRGRKGRVVVVDVALRTGDCRVRPGEREGRVVVVERCGGP